LRTQPDGYKKLVFASISPGSGTNSFVTLTKSLLLGSLPCQIASLQISGIPLHRIRFGFTLDSLNFSGGLPAPRFQNFARPQEARGADQSAAHGC
jgi:hypothetical protein